MNRWRLRISGLVVVSSLMAGCSSSTTTPDSSQSSDTAPTGSSESTVAAGAPAAFDVPSDAVTIDYFVAKGPAPLLKETLVPLPGPTKSVSMLVDKITYAGVVCGFSFTGADRPKPPVQFRMQVEAADGSKVDSTVEVGWTGDDEHAGSAQVGGWNFLSDAQINRNGPGWVVQLGAIPIGGGQGKPAPTRALCTLTAAEEMPISVGPVAYWAGFATV